MDGANDSAGEVLVGYLVTHPDGYEARLGPDRTRAELYAARNRAMLKPMFVRRSAAPSRQSDAGGPIGDAVGPG